MSKLKQRASKKGMIHGESLDNRVTLLFLLSPLMRSLLSSQMYLQYCYSSWACQKPYPEPTFAPKAWTIVSLRRSVLFLVCARLYSIVVCILPMYCTGLWLCTCYISCARNVNTTRISLTLFEHACTILE